MRSQTDPCQTKKYITNEKKKNEFAHPHTRTHVNANCDDDKILKMEVNANDANEVDDDNDEVKDEETKYFQKWFSLMDCLCKHCLREMPLLCMFHTMPISTVPTTYVLHTTPPTPYSLGTQCASF